MKCIGCVRIAEKNLNSKKDVLWIKCMSFGNRIGCHQMPERSFFWGHYQCPVCSRCVGVIISSIVASGVFFVYKTSLQICLSLCLVMFMDWLIQRVGIRESNNIRRLLTGLLGGYGFMTIQMYVYFYVYQCIGRLIY